MPHRLVPLITTLVTTLGLLLPVSALADPRYEVMNAPEGVYWRSEPNWAAAERVSGFGVYDGTIIEVHCYQSGTAVEGSADTMWEQATDVSGRGYGSGWVNEHFINDGQPINQPSPGVGPCNPPPPPHEEPPPPHVEEHHEESPRRGGLIFSIFNAEGGVYYRNSPHWADTSATPGVGVYNGDQVELICGAFGDPVGPFNDTAWSKLKNLTRPSIGEGWVNEHFINDGAPDNAFVAGESMCQLPTGGNNGPGGSASGGSGGQTSAPKSAFFWPTTSSSAHHPSGVPWLGISDADYEGRQWITGGCNPAMPTPNAVPASVNTLAGWSEGRLGPIYFLAANLTRWDQVHTIILFDPGNEGNMTGSGACDSALSPSINSLLSGWLAIDPDNELVILTGYDSEEHTIDIPILHKGVGESHYHGLWNYYLKDLWGMPWSVRSRAQICDYNNLGHEAVLQDFYGIVKLSGDGARPSGCPISPQAPPPTAWNP